MSRSAAVDFTPAVPVPRKLLLWLTYGVAGTVLFPIIYLIEGISRPGYNGWQQAISTLSLGPGGWIQQANFIMCGVSVIWGSCVAYSFVGREEIDAALRIDGNGVLTRMLLLLEYMIWYS